MGDRVGIGEVVNSPVKLNAMPDTLRVIELFLSFHIIADHITQEDLCSLERKICVGQVIHNGGKDRPLMFGRSTKC